MTINIERFSVDSKDYSLPAQLAVGAGCATLALILRLSLTPLIGDTIPFLTFFPAILIAAAWVGWRGGAACLALCTFYGVYFLVPIVAPGRSAVPGLIAALLLVLSGGLIGLVATMLRTALIQMESGRQRERVLLLEVQHRARNTLALVQSLAVQSFKGSTDVQKKAAFYDRLVALGQAHSLLSDRSWRSVDLRTVVQQNLKAFDNPEHPRIRIAGADLMVPPELVIDLGLCLHELATNATKYGALSVEEGRVDVTWTLNPHPPTVTLELVWTERGGPRVSAPDQVGFGSRLLTRAAHAANPREVKLTFGDDGVVWSLSVELELPRAGADAASAQADIQSKALFK